VFVCPLRKGAGIKNKILQAWSMAKPVVATSVSVGGLDCEDGRDIVVRDRADAFAGAVTKLLHDRDDAQRIGAAGRQKVIDRYTWSAKAAELDFVFQETRRARANANGPGAVR
jgi:glycosyltransferase involved in cell wall biosynthesis